MDVNSDCTVHKLRICNTCTRRFSCASGPFSVMSTSVSESSQAVYRLLEGVGVRLIGSESSLVVAI